ncbi:MAG: hypothetical protein Q9213_002415 [Squamulea squamosa]
MPGRLGRNHKRNAHHGWNKIAQTKLEAQSLAQRLHLSFPTSSNGIQSGFMYSIRRLIITSEDTPEDLALFLGSLWEPRAGRLRKKARIEVLIGPFPVGSPLSVSCKDFDNGFDTGPPNEAEEVELAKVRDFQGKIRAQVCDRKEITTKDTAMVLRQIGNHWDEVMPILEVAMNATDQGVYLDGHWLVARRRHPGTQYNIDC